MYTCCPGTTVMLCLRSAKLGSTDLMLSHTRFLLASETTVAVRTSWLPSTLSGCTWAPSISRVRRTGWYFCLSCSRSAMDFLLFLRQGCWGKRSSRLFQNVQFHHGFERRRLSGCQNRGLNLSRREDEVVRTVKLYQKAELESVGKRENTIFG